MLLVECNVLEQVKVIKEGTEGNSRLRLRGKFQQCDEQNNNGRIYPRKILEAQVQAIQEKIGDRSLVGALDHPANDAIHLSQASHVITGLSVDKDGSVIGECEILSTPNGKIVEALINDGVKIGISSRGVGSVTEGIKGKIVNEDFKLITFDLVSDPSTRGAFPELTESIRENSQRAQQIVSKHKKDRVLLTMLESKITEAMGKKQKKAKKPADNSDFPDLSGDDKTTFKDVLIGRGVISKGGEKTKKADREDSSTDIRAAVIEGFKRACWGDRYDELNRYEKELARKGHGETPIRGVTRAGVAHRQHRKGASDDAGVEANKERLRRKLGKTKPGDMPATPPHLQTNSTTLDKFADVIRERFGDYIINETKGRFRHRKTLAAQKAANVDGVQKPYGPPDKGDEPGDEPGDRPRASAGDLLGSEVFTRREARRRPDAGTAAAVRNADAEARRKRTPKPKKPSRPKPEPENSSTTIERFADVIRERCWKGYKPVKGKRPYSKGSCKKK